MVLHTPERKILLPTIELIKVDFPADGSPVNPTTRFFILVPLERSRTLGGDVGSDVIGTIEGKFFFGFFFLG